MIKTIKKIGNIKLKEDSNWKKYYGWMFSIALVCSIAYVFLGIEIAKTNKSDGL